MTLKDNHGLYMELWSKYEPKIRQLCEYKLQSSPDDIEDVVSETALALYAAIENKVEIKNYCGWIYATANNLIKQVYTKNNNNKNTLVSFNNDTEKIYSLSVGYDIDNAIVSDSVIEQLSEKLIDTLKPEERIIIKLFYEDKLKMKEIAETLNVSESAVKQRHYRLVRKIKKMAKELTENL